MFVKFLLLPVTFTVHAFQAACFKEFTRKFMRNVASYFLFNTLYFIIMVFFLLIMNGGIHHVSSLTLRMSLLQSVIYIGTTLVYMKAMASGPYSYTILIFSSSLIVPVLVGVLFWKDKITVSIGAGLALILVTLYLASRQGQGPSSEKTQMSRKEVIRWLLLSIAAMLLNGLLMTVSKLHQVLLPGKEISEFLILVFMVACVLSFILFLATRKKIGPDAVLHLKNRRFALLVLVTGMITAAGSYLLHYLESIIPASILYPSMNGGFTVVSAILSVIIFKEKLGKLAIAGLLTGMAALVLISL
jgi:drug/metabolite transporter (DMT)-like permease